MKLSFIAVSLLIVSLFVTPGCSKTDTPTSPTTAQALNSFSFTINGNGYDHKTVTLPGIESDSLGAIYFTNIDSTAVILAVIGIVVAAAALLTAAVALRRRPTTGEKT